METIKGLSEGQIEEIKRATEDILENVGFQVHHQEILRRCQKAGAKVADVNVRIPTPLLRELLARVPPVYSVYSCDGTEHRIGGENRYGQAIVTDPWIIDYQTRRPRKPCLQDIRNHTIIAQKLQQVVALSRMDFPVIDIPEPLSSLRALEEFFLYNHKHILAYVTSPESLRQYLDVAQILLPGKELKKTRLMGVAVGVVSPLVITEFNAELLLSACNYNFEVIPTICPMAGTTAPYTLASTLLIGNTENIFVAALTQIINPGNPFLYVFGPSVSNMRSGHDMYYTLDKVLWKIAGVRLGRSYNLPVAAECGGTMTGRYDQQNGAEGMLFMLSAFASGAHLLCGIGSCYNAVGMSAEMMLIQTAWLEAAEFLSRGINIDELHLGIENIKKAGPGGNFLTDDLTLNLLRRGEFFSSEFFDYSGDFGKSTSLLDRAHQKAEDLISTFESPIPEKVREEIRRYFRNVKGKI
ncbi:MAG: trimethylamine methyltransferase family protein [Candidatus Omnitrophota bacterium]